MFSIRRPKRSSAPCRTAAPRIASARSMRPRRRSRRGRADAVRARRRAQARRRSHPRVARRSRADHGARERQAADSGARRMGGVGRPVRVVRRGRQARVRPDRPVANTDQAADGAEATARRRRRDHRVELSRLQHRPRRRGGARRRLHARREAVRVHADDGDGDRAPAGRGEARRLASSTWSTANRARWARRCSRDPTAPRFTSRAACASASC